MKTVLIIDESALFREYLRIKLTDNGVDASVAINGLDGIAKMRNLIPDLVIMDNDLSKNRRSTLEVLKEKKTSPTTNKIPVILTAQHIDQNKIISLVPYNVKKVFTKPIKIDTFLATLTELLGVKFKVDDSPGIVEVHVNDDIIFVEIAQGLNRDKLDILRFKIVELIELYEIKIPKLIVMLSDIKCSFTDTPNIEKLLETVLQASNAKHRNIRILTKDDFVKNYIQGQKEYEDLEVVTNLRYALDGLLAELAEKTGIGEEKVAFIGDKVLQADESVQNESMQLRFNTEKNQGLDSEHLKEMLSTLKIAVVDDDFVIHELIKNIFTRAGATVNSFSDGSEYIAMLEKEQFDLTFLDLMMPKVDGFEVLMNLQSKGISKPIIVLSAVTQRETVVKAFQMGIKSYLVKPIKPDDIFKKTMEIMRVNF